jgi:hypothetical protein
MSCLKPGVARSAECALILSQFRIRDGWRSSALRTVETFNLVVDCAGHLSSSAKMLVFRGVVIVYSGMSQEEVHERESAGHQEAKVVLYNLLITRQIGFHAR